MTKAELYRLVESERYWAGLDLAGAEWYREDLNAIALSWELGIRVRRMDFKTRGLRGMALVENGLTMLNSRLTPEQQNFYACHELFHHLHHRDLNISSFQCYDMSFYSDAYYEWEANEGAAEMLVPYKKFLKIAGGRRLAGLCDLLSLQREIAHRFNVPLTTAALRFDTLKYELRQYLDGVPIDEIQVLSDTAQAQNGIFVKSFNELYPAPPKVGRPISAWAEEDFC